MEHKEVIAAILGIVAILVVVSMVVHRSYDGFIPGRSYQGTGWTVSGTPGLNMYWRGCTEGATQCVPGYTGANFMQCVRGTWQTQQFCSANYLCDNAQGCIPNRIG